MWYAKAKLKKKITLDGVVLPKGKEVDISKRSDGYVIFHYTGWWLVDSDLLEDIQEMPSIVIADKK